MAETITRKEIARFWKQRLMVEEDHLYAALKAAARLRARKLTDDDYLRFKLYLEEDGYEEYQKMLSKEMIRAGIKDWWTMSKFAYLNQPATKKFVDKERNRSSRYATTALIPQSST